MIVRVSHLVLAGLLVVTARAPAVESAAKGLRKSLVQISVTTQTPDYATPWNPGHAGGGIGTGFIISGNRIITNAHVISNAILLEVRRERDQRVYNAKVVHAGHDCDLAILSVDDPAFFENTEPLEFGDVPVLDSTVAAYGYPIGGSRLSVTRGIVSRIEFNTYSHTALDSHLTIQIDAAINPGNSGGPVIQGGKVVGVAFQGISGGEAENVGYMIPTPVIKRFLADIEDGKYDGYVELAVTYQNLLTPCYRSYLGLTPEQRGVIVTSVISCGSAAGILQKGDVLLKIDGKEIQENGYIELEDEDVRMEEIVERKFHGDKVVFDILRDGKLMKKEVTLKGAAPFSIYSLKYNERPRFVLFAGVAFQPLSRNFLGAHQSNNLEMMYYYTYYVEDELYKDHPELIAVARILPDPINTYLHRFRYSLVDEVNGVKIKRLTDLAAAFAKPADRYVIRMLNHDCPMVIEADQLGPARERILQRYQVLSEQYLGPVGPLKE